MGVPLRIKGAKAYPMSEDTSQVNLSEEDKKVLAEKAKKMSHLSPEQLLEKFAEETKNLIIKIPNFPKEGVMFYDLSRIYKDGEAFSGLASHLLTLVKDADVIIAPESRGFIVGSILAAATGKGFVPFRKAGKTPSYFHAETMDGSPVVPYNENLAKKKLELDELVKKHQPVADEIKALSDEAVICQRKINKIDKAREVGSVIKFKDAKTGVEHNATPDEITELINSHKAKITENSQKVTALNEEHKETIDKIKTLQTEAADLFRQVNPLQTISSSTEYSTTAFSINVNSLQDESGVFYKKAIIFDDVLATGHTAYSLIEYLLGLGIEVVQFISLLTIDSFYGPSVIRKAVHDSSINRVHMDTLMKQKNPLVHMSVSGKPVFAGDKSEFDAWQAENKYFNEHPDEIEKKFDFSKDKPIDIVTVWHV